jgi:hypothetical protein
MRNEKITYKMGKNICQSCKELVFRPHKEWPGAKAHAYNPSYSGGGDLENPSWRPAQAKSW